MHKRKWAGHVSILFGLGAGALCGGTAHAIWGDNAAGLLWITNHLTEPIGQLFLRLLLMLVVPLVFCSLTLGVAGMGDLRRLGRIGLKCLAYTLVISAISVVLGLTLTHIIRPGERMNKETSARIQERYGKELPADLAAAAKKNSTTGETPLMMMVKGIVPSNIVRSLASDPPDMLGLMFFSVFIGVMIALIGDKAPPLIALLESGYEAVAKGIGVVMLAAPYAVFSLLFTMTARFGFTLLLSLGWFVATVLIGLALHMFVVYSLSLITLSRISPIEFFRRTKVVMLTAFSTSSSNATLPTALREAETKLGIPRDINAFVLTVGATANQNGTALFEGVTILFLAQFAGVHLSLGEQLTVMYMAILGGIGSAGVPASSIPFITLVLAMIGINPALISLVIGVDRILDMCRTAVNVIGDLTAATYIARSEGGLALPEATDEEC